jgi:hypothetical protein
MKRPLPLLAAGSTLFVTFLALGPLCLHAADAGSALTLEQKEEFLRTAKIVKAHSVSTGITSTVRLTLSDGTVTHDASVQRIDESKNYFKPDNGPGEYNFKDTYQFNIAAWKLARLLGIENMMPPYVDRRYEGKPASFSWWVDDVVMDENERAKKKAAAPDQTAFGQEWDVVRVFDQLISNKDRNGGNVIYDRQWHVWMIDHTRAFRMQKDLDNPAKLMRCDRNLLAKMKALDEATLQKEFAPHVSRDEIRGLLARRDIIVKFFEAKGDSALYDRPARL